MQKRVRLWLSIFTFGISAIDTFTPQSALADAFEEGGSYGFSIGGVSSSNPSSSLATNLGTDPKRRLGLRASIFWERPMGKQLSWQPEIVLVQKGYSYLTKSGVRLTYLEVPVFLKWRSESVSPQFYGFVGPSLGYLVSANRFNEAGSSSTLPRREVNSIEVALQAGVGMEVPVAPLWSVFLQAGYSLGINSAFPDNVGSARNHVIALSLGLTHATEDGIDNKEERARNYLRKKQGLPAEPSGSVNPVSPPPPPPTPSEATPTPPELPAEPFKIEEPIAPSPVSPTSEEPAPLLPE